MQEPTANPFLRQTPSGWTGASVTIFLLATVIAWEPHFFAEGVLRSFNWVPYLVRLATALAGDALMVIVTIWLLRKNGLDASMLGLPPSINIFPNVLLGVLIGSASLALMEAPLFLKAPFHLVPGHLQLGEALKQGCSYLLGNSLEELIFRGFLLLVLSRYAGWRVAVLATSLLFGLFHLQGFDISPTGLSMAATTCAYSLVFGLACILTQSIWTAISVHLTSNILVHSIFGLDGMGNAILKPVLHAGSRITNGMSLAATIFGALAMSGLLYFAVSYKMKNAASGACRPSRVFSTQ